MEPDQTLPRPRAKRSHTTLPRFQGLKDAVISPVEGVKKHTKNRHSLHHPHFPHLHSRRDTNALGPYATNDDTSDQDAISRQQTRLNVDTSRDQSPNGPLDGQEARVPLAPVDLKKLAREHEARNARNEELRATLDNLSELSMATTRRLDDIYYSILEKTSQLQEIVHGLQELSNMSNHFHAELGDEVEALQTDIEGQVQSYNSFKKQEELIEEMESRITESKNRATDLSARLDGARRRVQALEVQEGEYQASVSRRFTIFWGALGGFAVFVLSLLLFSHHRHPGALPAHSTSDVHPGSSQVPAYNITSAIPMLAPIASIAQVAASQVGNLLPVRTNPGSLDDPRLELLQNL